jgi:hypothetical protein
VGREAMAHLGVIKLDLLHGRTDVGFPVDHEIDCASGLIGDRVGNTAHIGCTLVTGLCGENRQLWQEPAAAGDNLRDGECS